MVARFLDKEIEINESLVYIFDGNMSLLEKVIAISRIDSSGSALYLPFYKRFSIYLYTKNELKRYRMINNELRVGASRYVVTYSDVLSMTILEENIFYGIVYRGVTFDLTYAQDKYRPGLEIEWSAFTSASKNMDMALFGNIMFVISSARGCDIEHLSAHPEEEEVLFPPGTRFFVQDAELNDARLVVSLQEVV